MGEVGCSSLLRVTSGLLDSPGIKKKCPTAGLLAPLCQQPMTHGSAFAFGAKDRSRISFIVFIVSYYLSGHMEKDLPQFEKYCAGRRPALCALGRMCEVQEDLQNDRLAGSPRVPSKTGRATISGGKWVHLTIVQQRNCRRRCIVRRRQLSSRWILINCQVRVKVRVSAKEERKAHLKLSQTALQRLHLKSREWERCLSRFHRSQLKRTRHSPTLGDTPP